MKNKIIFRIHLSIFAGILLIIANGCDNEDAIELPKLTTTSLTEITQSSVKTGGEIISNGGTEIISQGICWGTVPNPTINSSLIADTTKTNSFTSLLSGLKDNTTYYLRAYATNSSGTAYGNELSFTSLAFNTYIVTDIEGNTYNALTIGSQDWFTENLKTSHYSNGDLIPDGTEIGDISSETNPKYCFTYDNNSDNITTYGKLYTWYTVTDSRNICPDGWHVPTDTEWITLTKYLGGESTAGGKLKEIGTNHWKSPNEGASNESGFSAIPGGYRYQDGTFQTKGYLAYWWSSTEDNEENASFRRINYVSSDIYKLNYLKTHAFSVRCIKN